MLGGRAGREGTICGCFETFVQTEHLGGHWRPRIVEGLRERGVSRGAVPSPGPLFTLKSGFDPGFGLSGLRQPGQPQLLLLRPWPRQEGDVQRLTSCPQRGEQTSFKNRLKIFTGSGPLSARRLRAAPAEAEEEPRREGKAATRVCPECPALSTLPRPWPEPGTLCPSSEESKYCDCT